MALSALRLKEVKEVLIHIRFNSKNALNMARERSGSVVECLT